ncbi:ribosomal RNA processing protein 36 homolog isoform X2 [Asparagus officinalis]|nr:ribosomal RNA processing protein 36 homolog isoform X2 [Asparagus officinalis]
MAKDRDESENEVSDEEIAFSSEEEKEIERKLADIPFEELQRARSDGSRIARPVRGAHKQQLGRANKNRPSELSCKVPVGRFRDVIQAPKKVVRDPRFESLCGKLDPEGFRKRYNFLYDVELPQEKEKLQKLIKKSKDANVIKELKDHISWIDKQLKSAPRRTVESEIVSEHIKKEREAAKDGKRPYYLKKSEIQNRKLVKKFDDLKAHGKLESFIEKKRRKNASKDHRFMPYRKSSEGVQD